jgi:L-lactate dehydrogenase complex protein LldG
MSDARAAILSRLRAAPRKPAPPRPGWTPPAVADPLAKFSAMLEAAHAEVHLAGEEDWPDKLRTLLAAKGVRRVVGASRFAAAWPDLIAYDRPVEDCKAMLVHEADAGITEAVAGIAETGTLVLAPSPEEPRLTSLLPPIHVAVVRADAIVATLGQALAGGGWAGGMPTNLLLISGPSKTADIEQTLAYGVHGPKELVVMVVR